MRIVIDLQGMQNGSRHRGIGRYALSFTKALIRNNRDHEIIIVLSSLFPDFIETIRAEFSGAYASVKIKVWEGVGPTSFLDASSEHRRKMSQVSRETFIASIEPDVLIVSSLVEGAGDNSVTSVGEFQPIFTAAILYDLIPLIYATEYLADVNVNAWYQDKLTQLKRADLWLAISESSREEGINYLNLPAEKIENISAAVGPEFKKVELDSMEKARLYGKFSIKGKFLMYSGATDPRKNIDRLIDAYAILESDLRATHQLVLAGGLPDDHRQYLERHALKVGLKPGEMVMTGRVTDDEMIGLYSTCKAFILPSYHEGFGLPALEAMACGAPTIGSNVSSIPEVIGLESALFDPRSLEDIARKITAVLTDQAFRDELVAQGAKQAAFFCWDRTANLALDRLESMQKDGSMPPRRAFKLDAVFPALIDRLASESLGFATEHDLLACATGISKILPKNDTRPRLYIDISELHRRDSRTGIQRVVRSIVGSLLKEELSSHKIELVYAAETQPYRVATAYQDKLKNSSSWLSSDADEIIDPRDGDIFLGLDYQDQIVFAHESFYRGLRRLGIKVYFVVYDLLPIQLTQIFSSEVSINYERWLTIVAEQDGVICISQTVADEFKSWVSTLDRGHRLPLVVHSFHLGADISSSVPTVGMAEDSDEILSLISSGYCFLSVGTIEPRKSQAQILSAFEQLWDEGKDVRLVLIGKQGWMVDRLVSKIRNHSELGKRLFWLEGISDEYLEKVYAASTCLIAASQGEGFGLPLIEAAQHNLPIIARDIPVFREVAAEHAFYFEGSSSDSLARAIQDWLGLFEAEKYPTSATMPWLMWEESAQHLKNVLFMS